MKRQRRSVSRPRSKRMPAPLRSGTRAPSKATFSTWNVPLRSTQIALPSALRPSARITGGVGPTPRIVRRFCSHTATSPRYSPDWISTTSPSRAMRAASATVRMGASGPTTSVAPGAAVAQTTSATSTRTYATRLQDISVIFETVSEIPRSIGGHVGEFGKQHVGEAEAREITHAHRIEDAVQVIGFVLDYPRMEAVHFAFDRSAARIEAAVAQARIARHDAAQS